MSVSDSTALSKTCINILKPSKNENNFSINVLKISEISKSQLYITSKLLTLNMTDYLTSNKRFNLSLTHTND